MNLYPENLDLTPDELAAYQRWQGTMGDTAPLTGALKWQGKQLIGQDGRVLFDPAQADYAAAWKGQPPAKARQAQEWDGKSVVYKPGVGGGPEYDTATMGDFYGVAEDGSAMTSKTHPQLIGLVRPAGAPDWNGGN